MSHRQRNFWLKPQHARNGSSWQVAPIRTIIKQRVCFLPSIRVSAGPSRTPDILVEFATSCLQRSHCCHPLSSDRSIWRWIEVTALAGRSWQEMTSPRGEKRPSWLPATNPSLFALPMRDLNPDFSPILLLQGFPLSHFQSPVPLAGWGAAAPPPTVFSLLRAAGAGATAC
jgi:hypothetical protein